MVAHTLFDQDDDGIVVLLVDPDSQVPADLEGKAREAVKLCPSQALTIVD